MSPVSLAHVLRLHPLLEPGQSMLAEAFQVALPESGQVLDVQQIARAADRCQGIVSLITDPIDESVLSVPGLRMVANVGVGFDNIDVGAATRAGVMVTNTPGVLDQSTADFAFALLMAAARRLVEGDQLVRRGAYSGWALDLLLGHDVHAATLGIIGMGRIGRAMAARARGFQMRVLYQSRTPLAEADERALQVQSCSLDELLGQADFVSLHVPLSPQTRHLIGARELQLMKPSAVLINTSRGAVVDEAALAAAITDRTIAAAGLDVFEHEPAVEPALIASPAVVLAPHLGSASIQTRGRMCEIAVSNLIDGLGGRRPQNLVNAEVLK
ncbi:MAG TPA: D-glycerate dehydrogenase [Candidatus Acidoferrales bacterium]|nr:D-glycerate dehydrogenase [Candidatus Acidoferrales bacterium]